jgi:hypothetical protein
MSTARIAPPEGGLSVFDHDPELWGTFNRFYGYLWTYGALDQPEGSGAAAQRAHRVPGVPQPPVRRREQASPRTTSSRSSTATRSRSCPTVGRTLCGGPTR